MTEDKNVLPAIPPAAPVVAAPPPLKPVEPESTEDEAEEAMEEAAVSLPSVELEIVNTGIRALKRGAVKNLDSMDRVLYVKEWPVSTGFRMISTIKVIVQKLVDNKVLNLDVDSTAKEQLLKGSTEALNFRFDNLLNVVADSQSSLLEALKATVYTDEECKTPVNDDLFDEISISDTIKLLVAGYQINVGNSALKKALSNVKS